MTSINLLELIPRCHAGSRAKGFWDVTPNKGQQLMLVVSELAEAMEADRKGRNARPDSFHSIMNYNPKVLGAGGLEEYFASAFVSHMKDSVGDELADAYIRLCDYVGGFHAAEAEDIARKYQGLPAQIKEDGMPTPVPDNFGEALLDITTAVGSIHYMVEEAQSMILPYIFLKLERLCERMAIDLATHIDLKLRYNATRPAKHGKAY